MVTHTFNKDKEIKETKLIKIINARQVLTSLSNMDINTHLAYWMTKFIINSQNEQDFYISNMRKLFDKYAERDEGGNFVIIENDIIIKKECIADFNKEVDELQSTDVEAPNIKFSLSEISKELKLSMKQMSSLMDFIEEDVGE